MGGGGGDWRKLPAQALYDSDMTLQVRAENISSPTNFSIGLY